MRCCFLTRHELEGLVRGNPLALAEHSYVLSEIGKPQQQEPPKGGEQPLNGRPFIEVIRAVQIGTGYFRAVESGKLFRIKGS